MSDLPQFMAISLLRFQRPRTVETFTDSHLDTKVRYTTLRADSFLIDGTIALEADVFCHVALCDDRETCDKAMEELIHKAQTLDGIAESIQLLLRPFTHRGTINWLDPVNPGPMFETHEKPRNVSPVVSMTSGGFIEPAGQMERVRTTLSNTVMVANDVLKKDGLQFRRVFSLCANFGDGVTFTVWESEDALATFAYGPGEHLDRVKPQLESAFHFDRTSFTRFTVEHSEGEWEGVRL